MAHHLILFIMLLYTAGTVSIRTLKHVTVREGGTITIPCLYDSLYKLNPKYWCTGRTWYLCTIKTHTNKPGEWLIIDDPAQNMFTVQFNNLTTLDSGFHWCAVQINNTQDHRERLYLTVQPAPDVSVMNSRVTGEEGGNISVQCHYSSGYKNKHKKWCRYKDRSCYTVGKTGTSQSASVQISDDGRRSFTVVMTGLMQSDSGWYYCSVGDLQVPVQLFVQWNNISKTENDERSMKNEPMMTAVPPLNGTLLPLWVTGPLLLLLMLVLLTWWIKHKHNGVLFTPGPDTRTTERGSVSSCYTTIVFKKSKDIDEEEDNHVSIHCSPDPDDEVVYSTLKHLDK